MLPKEGSEVAPSAGNSDCDEAGLANGAPGMEGVPGKPLIGVPGLYSESNSSLYSIGNSSEWRRERRRRLRVQYTTLAATQIATPAMTPPAIAPRSTLDLDLNCNDAPEEDGAPAPEVDVEVPDDVAWVLDDEEGVAVTGTSPPRHEVLVPVPT